jgi:DNA transformation protein
MKSSPAFLAKVMEKLTPHGRITSRAMFGGYGIYDKGVMFACIVENELYFSVDDENRPDFEKYKAQPFVYEGGKKPIVMPYLTLPKEIFNNPKLLKSYIERAYEVSLRRQLKKKKRIKSRV